TLLKSDWLRVAAIVLITLSLNAVYQHYVADNKELAMSIVSVPAGQRTNVTLPDGTNVWLNARTTIRFPEKFSTRNRTVELMGEGYFDVVKDKERPFIVKTDKYSIEVLGTKFDVEAYPDEEKFVTTLMQGSVKLTSQASPSHQVTLKPEHKATLKDGRLEVSKVTDFNPYRWKEGLISFKDEPFLTIMKDLEKYYGFKIIINNQDVLKYSYTGSFRQTDGVDYALRVLQNDISFSYKKDNETQIIHIN
ncbi:MAG: FecR family protein, partial [Macellibacteroides fermentans]